MSETSATTKKSRIQDPAVEKLENLLPPDRGPFTKGIGGKNIAEEIPTLDQNERETVYGNDKVNSSIVLGADRPGNKFTGFSGMGHTQCSMIDIVVGRMGVMAKKTKVDPNFTTDAARIYISQKTMVDENFNLATPVDDPKESKHRPGTYELSPKSAIALKADEIRLISREGIRLVTGVDAKNSQGGTNASIQGIDLIAGNQVGWDMGKFGSGEAPVQFEQPIVKGDNLVEALTNLVQQVDNLNGIVGHMMTTQANFNEAITHHYHFSPFFGNPALPSDIVAAKGIKCLIDTLQDTARSLASNKANMVNYRANYLMVTGRKYINSRWNRVN